MQANCLRNCLFYVFWIYQVQWSPDIVGFLDQIVQFLHCSLDFCSQNMELPKLSCFFRPYVPFYFLHYEYLCPISPSLCKTNLNICANSYLHNLGAISCVSIESARSGVWQASNYIILASHTMKHILFFGVHTYTHVVGSNEFI